MTGYTLGQNFLGEVTIPYHNAIEGELSMFAMILTGLFGFLFVLFTLVTLCLANPIARLVNRQMLKEMLNGDRLLFELGHHIERAEKSEPTELTKKGLSESQLYNQWVSLILPPGWASRQSDALVDACFDFLEAENNPTFHFDQRDEFKMLLSGDRLLREVFPTAITLVQRALPEQEELRRADITDTEYAMKFYNDFLSIIHDLLPLGWASRQTDALVDASFDFLNAWGTQAFYFEQRDEFKKVFDGDQLLREVVPLLVAAELRLEKKLEPKDIKPLLTLLEAMIEGIVPAGWASVHLSAAIDALFDTINLPEVQTFDFEIAIASIMTRLYGEQGRQLIEKMLFLLPECNEAERAIGEQKVSQPISPVKVAEQLYAHIWEPTDSPDCLPVGVEVGEVAAHLHPKLLADLERKLSPSIKEGKINYQQLMKLLDNLPRKRGAEEAIIIEEVAQMIKAKLPSIQRRARMILLISRFFWIIPLLCLLPLLFFQVDSLQGFGYWVGRPVRIATLLIFVIRFGLPFMLKRAAFQEGFPEIHPAVQMVLTELERWWLGPLQRQGIIMLAVSLVLFALTFVPL